jgi:hypothetical protein
MAAILIITFAMGLIVGLPVAITMGISGLTAVLIDGRFPPWSCLSICSMESVHLIILCLKGSG